MIENYHINLESILLEDLGFIKFSDINFTAIFDREGSIEFRVSLKYKK